MATAAPPKVGRSGPVDSPPAPEDVGPSGSATLAALIRRVVREELAEAVHRLTAINYVLGEYPAPKWGSWAFEQRDELVPRILEMPTFVPPALGTWVRLSGERAEWHLSSGLTGDRGLMGWRNSWARLYPRCGRRWELSFTLITATDEFHGNRLVVSPGKPTDGELCKRCSAINIGERRAVLP